MSVDPSPLTEEGTVSNPRRSSSMGSLSDPDPYWAMSTTALKVSNLISGVLNLSQSPLLSSST